MEVSLKPKDISQMLGMSLVWVYKAVEKGELPFYRIGDAIRFNPSEIQTYLEKRKNLKREKN
jgi:excisionase family DNA binding protein